MLLKIAGAVSVIAAATLLGFEMSKTLKRRVEGIEGFISSLQYIENAIDFTLTPVDEIVETLAKEAKGAAGEFFGQLTLTENDSSEPDITYTMTKNLQARWQAGLSSLKGISKEDKAVLAELGNALGATGKDAQIATLRLCRRRLECLLESAKSELSQSGKMLQGLGFFGGVLMAIILI